MNKRYQVFVSSTFKDLAEERMEVIKALLELDCIPCGMEYFPAASEDSWSYISTSYALLNKNSRQFSHPLPFFIISNHSSPPAFSTAFQLAYI